MSDGAMQSQGAKLAEISGLLSGVQERNLPVERNGQSVDIPISSRAPTVRAEEREVRTVRKPQAVDLAKISIEDLKDSDLSALAKQVAGVKPIGEPPVEMVQQYQTIMQAVAQIQAEFNSIDFDAIAQTDPGRALWLQQGLAHRLTELRPAREWCAQFEAEYQNAIRHNSILGTAHGMLERHPWLASARHHAEAVAWAKRTHSMTDADIAQLSDADFEAGVIEFEEYCAKKNKRLTPNLERKVVGEAVSAQARKLKAKNNGRLSREQAASLVSQLLGTIE